MYLSCACGPVVVWNMEENGGEPGIRDEGRVLGVSFALYFYERSTARVIIGQAYLY